MTVFLFFCLLTAIVSFSFGVFCLVKNPRNPTNVTFFANSLANTFWSAGLGLMTVASSQASADSWITIHYAGASMIPPTYALYAYTFLRIARNKRFVLTIWWLIGVAFLALTIFHRDLFISAAPRLPLFSYYTRGGIFYAAYAIWFFLCVGAAVASLMKNLHGRPGVPAKHVRYVLLATAVGFGGGCTAFFPVFNLNVYPFGMAVVFLYPVIMSYAIIRHRLMDIEVVIKKTLVFTGLFAMVMAVVAGVMTLTQGLISRYAGLGTALSTGLCVALAILLYDPTRRFVTNATDRFLFQKKESIKEVLRRLSERVITILDLDEVARTILETFEESLRAETGVILLKNKGGYQTLNSYGLSQTEVTGEYTQDNPLIQHFRENPHLIHRSVWESAQKMPREVLARLDELKAEVAIPLFLHRELIGLLTLGKKKSDQEYSQEEIDYLPTVAVQVAIALSNAQLYGEAIAARKKIEEMQIELIHREKMAFVSDLVKGIAHEVFNPLTPVFQAIDLLEQSVFVKLVEVLKTQENKMDPEAAEEYFKALEDLREVLEGLKINTQHIYHVIDTLSKLQKEDKESIGAVDLKTFLKDSMTLIAMELHGETREIPVIQEVPRGLPPVRGNPTLLAQVFVNLFKNAIHAMDGKAEKKITIRAASDPDDGRFLKIEFRDTGSGIPADLLERIFDFGFTTKGGKGQGIGLSQCRIIIEKFGGSLSCKSSLGEGATFTMKLPIWKEEKN